MANEITLNLSLAVTNGKMKQRFEPGAISVTQSAAEAYAPVVSVGTSEEDLPVGDVATVGFFACKTSTPPITSPMGRSPAVRWWRSVASSREKSRSCGSSQASRSAGSRTPVR